MQVGSDEPFKDMSMASVHTKSDQRATPSVRNEMNEIEIGVGSFAMA
jgi:hypothetical protein